MNNSSLQNPSGGGMPDMSTQVAVALNQVIQDTADGWIELGAHAYDYRNPTFEINGQKRSLQICSGSTWSSMGYVWIPLAAGTTFKPTSWGSGLYECFYYRSK